jgi:hypothetical protein
MHSPVEAETKLFHRIHRSYDLPELVAALRDILPYLVGGHIW